MGAYLPHGTPCEQTSASEGNTSVTSSAPLVLGHGTEVAAAEAGQSTALVLEAPATASSLAPPPSAHTGSEHRGQPSERPPTQSTPTQLERSEGRSCRERHGLQPLQEIDATTRSAEGYQPHHVAGLAGQYTVSGQRRTLRTGARQHRLSTRGPCRIRVRRAEWEREQERGLTFPCRRRTQTQQRRHPSR